MFRCSLILFILLSPIIVHAQHSNNWVLGLYGGINFNTCPPNTFTPSNGGSYLYSQAYSHCNGQLLFYTYNTREVWNKEHKPIPSYKLLDSGLAKSNTFFVPDPGDDSQVYMFTTSPLKYSILDVRLDTGRGDVKQNPQIIIDSVGYVGGFIKHANDTDYWILVKTNIYNIRVYLLTKSGISSNAIISPFIGMYGLTSQSPLNSPYLRISNNGKMVISPFSNNNKWNNYIYDFDRTTGKLSQARSLEKYDPNNWEGYHYSFSPNDSIIYAMKRVFGKYPPNKSYRVDTAFLYQIKSYNAQPYKTLTEVYRYPIKENSFGGQLAPDNKLYMSCRYDTLNSYAHTMSYIPYPDIWGKGCGFVMNGFIFPDSVKLDFLQQFPCYAYPIKRIKNHFDITGTNGCGYDSVSLTADADTAFKSYHWYFGDGDSAIGKSVVHQYKNPGSYYVRLGCELGNCGYMQWVGDSVIIKFKPTISLNTNKTIYCGYQTISAQVNYRYSDTVQVAWGDGIDTLLYVADTNLVDSVQLQHIYIKTGNYAISCKAWNSNCYDSVANVYNIVVDTIPKTNFTADYITSCGVKTFILSDTSKFDSVVINRVWHIYKTNGLDTSIATGTVNNLSFLFNDTGVYSVKLIIQSKQGCTDSLEKINYIQINPNPVSKISGKIKWCGTDSTTLTASGGSAYKWSTGDTSASVFLKPVISNYYSVLVTNIYNCSVKDSVYISVGKIVTPYFTPNYLQSCGNSTITLTDSSGMDSILQQRIWRIKFPNNTIVAYDTVSTNKLKLIVQDTGYYNAKLIYITKQGCMDSLTKTNVFRILPQPVVYIDSPSHNPLCFGDSFILTAKQKDINYPPLVKYKWNAGQVATPSIKIDSANSYYVSATNAYGCGAQSNTVKISFLPQLFANIKTSKDSLYIIATRPIVNYTWYKDSIFYNTSSSLLHPPTGRYYVHVVDGNGCEANSGSLLHTGVNHIADKDNMIRVYPNPTNDVLYIEGLPNGKTSIVLYDMLGKKVYNTITNGEVLYNISIGYLPKGLYILSVGEEKIKLAVE